MKLHSLLNQKRNHLVHQDVHQEQNEANEQREQKEQKEGMQDIDKPDINI